MRPTLSLFLMTLLAAAPAAAFQTPPATTAQTPIRVGGQTKAPERLKYVAPVYPEIAIASRVSGIVIVEATIGKDGSVSEAHVIRSVALLDQAALDAVKQWKYTPTTRNGAPVPVIMTVSVSFTAPGVETTTAPSGRAIAPAPTPQAAEAPAAPQRQVDPRIDQSDVNIKLIVTITDKSSSATLTKIVSVIMANRGNGRVRSQGSTLAKDQVLAGGTLQGTLRDRSSELNVDARATLLKNGSISTDLTISYTPEWTDETTKMTSVSQSVSLYLKDGVPTVIAQAADPTKGSRSVSIEVTASVMK